MGYKPKIKDKDIDELFKAILTLETVEECYRFFEDICTVKEVISFSQRLQVAKLLQEEKTYEFIENETGASTATISRINKFLHYGSDGYKVALKRLKENNKI